MDENDVGEIYKRLNNIDVNLAIQGEQIRSIREIIEKEQKNLQVLNEAHTKNEQDHSNIELKLNVLETQGKTMIKTIGGIVTIIGLALALLNFAVEHVYR